MARAKFRRVRVCPRRAHGQGLVRRRRFGWLWLVTSEAMEAAFRRERELSLLGAMRAAAKTFGLKANDVQHVLAPTKRS